MQIPKFRAWHKTLNIMCAVHRIYFDKDYVDLYDESKHHLFGAMFHEIELMQWAAVISKNQKEIYVGDIVSWKFKDRIGLAATTPTEGCGVVTNQDGLFMVERPKYFGEFMLCGSEDYLKVIGNIYQNPELVEC